MELTSQATIAQGYEHFHEQFATFFQRSETRQRVPQYIRGLLATVKRKNGIVKLTEPMQIGVSR